MQPVFPIRKNLRLCSYDYSSDGFYFVTICTARRRKLFGDIANGTMIPDQIGKMVDTVWSKMFAFADQKTWVVMPNHFHGIIKIRADESGRKPLGRLVAAFKTVSTRSANQIRRTPGAIVWQRNFYEHIIGTDQALDRILAYIEENPARWENDPENPSVVNRRRSASEK